MQLFQKPIGTDIVVTASVSGGKLVVSFEISAEKEMDMLIDKLEAAIPGDQTGMAASLKVLLDAELKG